MNYRKGVHPWKCTVAYVSGWEFRERRDRDALRLEEECQHAPKHAQEAPEVPRSDVKSEVSGEGSHHPSHEGQEG